MRIISQKGNSQFLDLPYERTELKVSGCFISVNYGKYIDRVIARYSTPEKAEKAMEMLWDEYQNTIDYGAIFRFPEDSEV